MTSGILGLIFHTFQPVPLANNAPSTSYRKEPCQKNNLSLFLSVCVEVYRVSFHLQNIGSINTRGLKHYLLFCQH